jgi:hypothetical protein
MPSEDMLSVRVKLRTGQLDDAQRILEAWAAAERDQASSCPARMTASMGRGR